MKIFKLHYKNWTSILYFLLVTHTTIGLATSAEDITGNIDLLSKILTHLPIDDVNSLSDSCKVARATIGVKIAPSSISDNLNTLYEIELHYGRLYEYAKRERIVIGNKRREPQKILSYLNFVKMSHIKKLSDMHQSMTWHFKPFIVKIWDSDNDRRIVDYLTKISRRMPTMTPITKKSKIIFIAESLPSAEDMQDLLQRFQVEIKYELNN